jgi:hypothetical protein
MHIDVAVCNDFCACSAASISDDVNFEACLRCPGMASVYCDDLLQKIKRTDLKATFNTCCASESAWFCIRGLLPKSPRTTTQALPLRIYESQHFQPLLQRKIKGILMPLVDRPRSQCWDIAMQYNRKGKRLSKHHQRPTITRNQ